ncbi:MAG: hypothetical protein LUF02_09985 [Erysipelotrichaceae bacterium]|nr:hypothetical protein [Erysipelotrichaceae bacterium]
MRIKKVHGTLADDWTCPICKAGKGAFIIQEETPNEKIQELEKPHVEKELSSMEMSIICSNLACGCEKQYMFDACEKFNQLADFFKSQEQAIDNPHIDDIIELIQTDLSTGYPYAYNEASQKPDRGALRALVWSEKVSKMLQSLLNLYKLEGEKMLENTGVYVCNICGFVYIGDEPPALCPVCKVPSWKFEEVKGRDN